MSDILGFIGSAIDWFLDIPFVSWIMFFVERLAALLHDLGVPFKYAYVILIVADSAQSIIEYTLLHLGWSKFRFMRTIHTPKLLQKIGRGAGLSYIDLFFTAFEPMAKKFGIITLHARRHELSLFRGFIALGSGSAVRILFYPLLGKYIFAFMIPFLLFRIWEWRSRNGTSKKNQEELRS
ncbi:MAG: hypothetical protein PHY34_03390 [Patescibacteria group bacterium]|nr:hypothetical protein [Patescibacteria group bacterium]MDD5716081.1 hypothetical protein [Patescibacteria group bacterium]